MLNNFLNTIQSTKAQNTYSSYRTNLYHWFADGETNFTLEYINDKLMQWKIECVSENTIALRCRILRKYLHFYKNYSMVENAMLIENVLSGIQTKETIPDVVTIEQYKQIIKFAKSNPKLQICIDLMFQNGLRANEVLSIRNEDYSPKDGKIIVKNTKNRNDYEIYITPALNEKIKQYYKPDTTYLITSVKGKQMCFSSLKKLVKDVCSKAGYPNLHCHSFRHGSAMYLLEQGTNLFIIKEHLRHKSLQSTQRYLHIDSKQKRKVRDMFSEIC